jgi:subtilase family serine protease
MKTMLALSWHRRILVCGLIAAGAMAAISAGAQSVAPRIRSEISSSEQATLKGSLHPWAQARFDAGRVPADMKLNGVSMVFNRTAAQQADLDALIAAQQNPASPLYHQWLTPEQFAARFGMAESDLNKVEGWLEQQGFVIDSVARSRNLIRFSGSVAQVERAFSTQMHYYTIGGVRHFAPSSELTLPAAIVSTVESIRNLNDLRPKANVVLNKNLRGRPSFTSSKSGNVYFSPGDIATVYNIKTLYAAGANGTGQTIAVVGQSAVNLSDIEAFQNAAGMTVKDPTQVLMPGTGTSAFSSGDETESDLDLEWSGATAPGADIFFVYTGSSQNYGTFDALQYAIDEKIANIITVSYGACEPELGGSNLESTFQQATAQGQTIIAASGDSGSTACFAGTNVTNPPLATQEEVAVNYPASSPYVTGLGGTEISNASSTYDTQGEGYWAAEGSSDVISSALQYIPEMAWNDDASGCGTSDCISAGGGGASTLFSKPSWQTGVAGIPSDGKRDVPDIALYSSPDFPGYLYCTSDTSAWVTGQVASCNSGFRDSSTNDLTVAGGTSFAAPIFAGMLAIINQKAGYVAGQGLINPTLYTLAANSSNYAAGFHDITTGNNDCTAGSTYCAQTTGFAAGVGYDQVTGLGSVNLAQLVPVWPANTGTTAGLIGTTTTITATSTSPNVNTTDTFTITVVAASGTTAPTGTVTLQIDGGTAVTGGTTATASLTASSTSGTATGTYQTSFSTAGTHQIIAQYPVGTTFAASAGVVQVTVAGTSSNKGTITLSSSPTTLTVSQGTSGTETLTVTPAGGYTGTVILSFDTSNDSALQNLCYNFTTTLTDGNGSVPVTGTAAVSTQLIFDTNASDCVSTASRTAGGKPMHSLRSAHTTAKNNPTNPAGPLGIAFGGLLMAGFLGRYSRKFRSMAAVIALLAVGLAVSACGGGSSSSSTPSNPPKGTYTVTVTGTDSATATITGTTQFTFTID